MEFILSLLIPSLLAPVVVVPNVAQAREVPVIEIVQEMPVIEPVVLPSLEDRVFFAKNIIGEYANRYEIPADPMYKIVSCETGGRFEPDIQSLAYKNGVQEDSWGLAQIHLPSWPDITREQAIDPDFAINFLASNIKAGRPYLWTCWRILKEKGEL